MKNNNQEDNFDEREAMAHTEMDRQQEEGRYRSQPTRKNEWNPTLDKFELKDKRISFLSNFRALTQMWQGTKTTKEDYDNMIKTISEKAFEITEELYKRYGK